MSGCTGGAGSRPPGAGALYAPGSPFSFTYPPFAALVFATTAGTSIGFLKIAITAASVVALAGLCGQSLAAAGLPRRPETVFAPTALALLTWPVAYTLQLGEINLILAALIGADLLRRRDGSWWQAIGVGLAAGIKLTPLIFVAYLLLTRRYRAAATAVATFAATVATGFALLPSQSTTFWLHGVFHHQSRVGNPSNPSNQSLAGAVARLAGSTAAATAASRPWWVVAVLVTSVASLAIAAWAHRRGHRLAGVTCCAITGLLISPISWTHHWVWVVLLLIALPVAAWQHRSFGIGLIAAVVAVGFCGHITMLWPGHPPSTQLLPHRPACGGVAASVVRHRFDRSGGRGGVLRAHHDAVARSSAQYRAARDRRPLRPVRPGRAGGHRARAGPRALVFCARGPAGPDQAEDHDPRVRIGLEARPRAGRQG